MRSQFTKALVISALALASLHGIVSADKGISGGASDGVPGGGSVGPAPACDNSMCAGPVVITNPAPAPPCDNSTCAGPVGGSSAGGVAKVQY